MELTCYFFYIRAEVETILCLLDLVVPLIDLPNNLF